MILWMANVNYRFGANAFLPYSAGRLWSFAKNAMGDQLSLAEILWDREPIDAVIGRMRLRPPDALAISIYIWSEQWSLALAEAVRHEFPSCRIIAGGPQVPTTDTMAWLLSNDINVAVTGEGEKSFVEALRSTGDKVVLSGEKIDDLSTLPSPYLDGVFDDIVRSNPHIQWQALQETNRGCPYQCTFCDWGSATYSKVRKFPLETCVKELEWFGANGIDLLYNCDANFGMLEQDVAFAESLIDASRRNGAPTKFRAAYAKKINDRVFGVAKMISDAGMSKGATISFQSLDDGVLKLVKRLNPVQKSLRETFDKYNSASIPTYTELIVGLPGETLDSFKNGICQLLDAGQHYGLNVYPCMALRNSEMSTREDRERFGLNTARVDLLLLHGSPDSEHIEKYDLVIETSTMSHEEWREAWWFGIVVQALHCSGITTEQARQWREKGWSYRDFYELLIHGSVAPYGTVIRNAKRRWERVLNNALKGQPWDTVLPQYGDIQWPPEEFVRILVSEELGLVPDDDREEWAREVVWYGRKGKLNQGASHES